MRLDRVAAYDSQLVRSTRHDPNIQAEPEEPTLGLLPENAWAERGARIETQPCIVDNFGADAPKGELDSRSSPVRVCHGCDQRQAVPTPSGREHQDSTITPWVFP